MINLLYVFKFMECGKFCINYILRRDKIKKKVGYNGVMMSLGLVKRVLKEYYDSVQCYELKKIDMIGHKRFVTLLKYGKRYMHYVVVEKVSDDKVSYYDPLFLNLRTVKKDKFEQRWSGYCCFIGKKSNC